MQPIIKYKPSKENKVYKPSKPFLARVLENKPLVDNSTQDQIQHVVLDIQNSGMQFLEGQSVGVVPPGQRENGRPNKIRLYSIASARFGEAKPAGLPKDLALCVKKDVFQDSDTGETGYGLCSKYLCEIPVGTPVQITGPVGRSFLLPTDHQELLIMIGVGTGIAPYRGFVQYLTQQKGWAGNCELYFGCKTQVTALYLNQVNQDLKNWQQQVSFPIQCAFSREQFNADGQRLYVQHVLQTQAERLWSKIANQQACVYICGLKGVQHGVEEVMQALAVKNNVEWSSLKRTLRDNGRWNVEVY